MNPNPLTFMKHLLPILCKLTPDEAAKIGQAMDCAVAYGAMYEIGGIAPGMDPATFRHLYEAKVQTFLET